MLLVHMLVPIPISDDIWFLNAPSGIFDWSLLVERYLNWTSRLLIDAIVVALLHLPTVVWGVLNSAIIVLFAISLSKLFVHKNKRTSNWFITFLLFTYPFFEISITGWINVSVNYIWPLSLGTYSLILVKKIISQKNIHKYEYILSALALFIAINQELMCAVLLLILVIAAVYLIIKRQSHWFIIFAVILCAIGMIYILTTPGNQVRTDTEMRWFEDFNHISIIEKLEIGISSTLEHYFFNFNFLSFILFLLLFLAVNQKHNERLYRLFSLIPLVVIIMFGNGFYQIVDRLFPHLASLDSETTTYGLITLQNFTVVYNYVPFLILCITAFSIAVSLYLIFENTWRSILAVGTLIIGFISRMIMALTPTIYASGTRTHFLLYSALIVCSIMVIQFFMERKPQRYIDNLLLLIGFIGGISYINLLMSTK